LESRGQPFNFPLKLFTPAPIITLRFVDSTPAAGAITPIHTTMLAVSHRDVVTISHQKMRKAPRRPLASLKAPLSDSFHTHKPESPTPGMTTRSGILSRPGLILAQGPPRPTGARKRDSPTKSIARRRWAQLVKWSSFPQDVLNYISSLPYEEHHTVIASAPYMDDKEKDLNYGRLPVREDDIGDIFGTLFRIPHNLCVNEQNVCHPHARVARCRGDDETHPDFTFEHDWDTTAVIEVKKFWKVTKEQIEQVLNGASCPMRKC
jgi:hypothetical protein